MGILDDMLKNVRTVYDGLQDGSLIRGVVEPYGDEVLELQKIQLLEGKSVTGDDMRPYYSEDLKPRGYFSTQGKAEAYRAWKQDLSYPYSVQRNPDAPNLYINGKFHSELALRWDADMVHVVGTTSKAKEIMSKYAGQFGLNWGKWNEVLLPRGYNDLMNAVREIIYE